MKKRACAVYLSVSLMVGILSGCAAGGEAQKVPTLPATETLQPENEQPKATTVPEENPKVDVMPTATPVLEAGTTQRAVRAGQEFCVGVGEIIRYEGDEAFEMQLVQSEKLPGSDIYRSEFLMKDGDERIEVIFFDSTEEGEKFDCIVPGNYTQPHKITLISMEDGKATLSLAERVTAKLPITFSGNASDIYRSAEYNYIETEHCFIYFDREMDVPQNFGVMVEDTIAEIEKQTGLKFKRKGSYDDQAMGDVAEVYLGMDPWEGVNPYKSKIDMYVFEDREEGVYLVSAASRNTLVFITNGILKGNRFYGTTLAHELVHVLFMYHMGESSRTIAEGLGDFYGCRVAEAMKDRVIVTVYDSECYLGVMDELVETEDAEALFNEDFDERGRADAPYQYGIALCTYLYETYGEDWILRYIAEINPKHNPVLPPDYGVEAEVLKGLFSEQLFTDFQTWYRENRERFEIPEPEW